MHAGLGIGKKLQLPELLVQIRIGTNGLRIQTLRKFLSVIQAVNFFDSMTLPYFKMLTVCILHLFVFS
jgi:hypothetical protein